MVRNWIADYDLFEAKPIYRVNWTFDNEGAKDGDIKDNKNSNVYSINSSFDQWFIWRSAKG